MAKKSMFEEKLSIALRNTEEVITKEEMQKLVESGDDIRVYAGYEPSGKIHLGHALSVNKLIDFQKLGANVVVLLADLHAYLNEKGSLDEIRKTAEYNKRCFIALGLDKNKTEFILGSEIQLEKEYFLNVNRLARETTLLRARRSMDLISREEQNPKVARVIYPLMQVADIIALNVNVAIGGMDQRKIHMLAREVLPKLGFETPICLHLPIIHGLDGSDKMSSSKGNFISVDDSYDEIKKKIRKAFCPEGIVKGNPVLEIYKYHIFPKFGKIIIEREEKFGGSVEYTSYEELEKDFAKRKLHPLDLKNSAINYIESIVKKAREKL